MDTFEKLSILSDASRYDLSCACGTKQHDHRVRGKDGSWLYPVTLANGGQSVMLKSLMSNVCSSDCGYCPYRSSMDGPRCGLNPAEMASAFMEFVGKGGVFGLFLSSGIVGNADRTMQLLTDTASILRRKFHYRGFVHLKVIPGASEAAIDAALGLADAVSVNIETPGAVHCSRLSSRKDFLEDIIRPMKHIAKQTAKGMPYSRVAQSTQFIVGASDETDAEIVKYTAAMYGRLGMNRVYFSAYQKGLGRDDLPGEVLAEAAHEDRFVREHRLYQVDFLFRKYGFSPEEIVFDAHGRLDLSRDPKQVWAERHPGFFPVDLNRACREDLLRVPGIGPATTDRIMAMRREAGIRRIDALPLKGKRLEKARSYLRV